MTIKEFLKYDVSRSMYQLVDVKRVGFMTDPAVIIEVDKNVLKRNYGELTIIGFEPVSKNKIRVYAK